MSVGRDDLVLEFWNERLDTPLCEGHVAEFEAAPVTLYEGATYTAPSSPDAVSRESTPFSDTAWSLIEMAAEWTEQSGRDWIRRYGPAPRPTWVQEDATRSGGGHEEGGRQ